MADKLEQSEVIIAANQKIKERDYWLNNLSGFVEKNYFPTDYDLNLKNKDQKKECFLCRFPTDLSSKLSRVSGNSDLKLHVLLSAGLVLLLHKYTGNEDIAIGAPMYKQVQVHEIDFINTVLILRNFLRREMTFRELLQQMKETIAGAVENRNYPIEILAKKLDNSYSSGEYFPLFDVTLLVQNIQEKSFLQSVKHNMTFSFLRTGEYIEAEVEYNTLLYCDTTVERIMRHFMQLLGRVLLVPQKSVQKKQEFETLSSKNEGPGAVQGGLGRRPILENLELKLFQIDILSTEEKKQIIFDFNDTEMEYPQDKTVKQLIEEQVERTPNKIAVVGPSTNTIIKLNSNNHESPLQITYREMNEKSIRLARLLMQKGMETNDIVGTLVKRSVEAILGIFSILKAGGTYLPIDLYYPSERKKQILLDCNARFAITDNNFEGGDLLPCEIINVVDEELFRDKVENIKIDQRPDDLIYIIFTSGSTGLPKGSAVYYHGFTNLVNWYVKEFDLNCHDKMLLLTSLSFDLTQKNIFTSFSIGGTLYITLGDYFDPLRVRQEIYENRLTWINCTPEMFYRLLEEEDRLNMISSLRYVFLGGEPIKIEMLRSLYKSVKWKGEIVNTYGPTECTDVCTYFRIKEWEKYLGEKEVPIGRPIFNTQLYILDRFLSIVPIGVLGELCISGKGMGAGYINRPEMTREKFVKIPFIERQEDEFYRTGDLARWLWDGNIEFLGRIDQQIKIRGIRVELGEIANRLLNVSGVKEVVVLVNEEIKDDKYICAYFVSEKEYVMSELREYLSRELPDYMIPSYFVPIDKIPLTPNGKVDRGALPEPGIISGKSYIAPRDVVEEKLARMWSEVLFGKNSSHAFVGIDDNFFQLGGHSLKAVIMLSRVHRELNVNVPLAEIFRTPTIKGLADYIRKSILDRYTSIEPIEKKEYYVLSSAQQRMYILQQIDLNSTAYNIPQIIPLAKEIYVGKLEDSFKKLIKRHETLRTSFHMIEDQPLQKINEEVVFEIEKYKETTIHQFIRSFDLSRAPLLRIGELKAEGRNYLLVDMHHIICDGISHQVLREEFMAFYEGKDLPQLRIQYKDFAQWQKSLQEVERIDRQMSFWLKEFEGEIPLLEIPMDFPRPLIQSFEGNRINFEISAVETQALNALALQRVVTIFMVLMAIINILLSKLSGQEDIIIGTPIAGRRHSDLEKIIGMFVNTLALRNYPVGDRTFIEFLDEIKKRTLDIFENQEYPFEELVDKLSLRRDSGRNPLFDVMFVMQNMNTRTITLTEKKDTELHQSIRPDLTRRYENMGQAVKLDLTFTAMEIGQKIFFSIQYCTKLFKIKTIERFSLYFKKIVFSVLREPDIRIKEIDIISEEEKHLLLYDFNDTKYQYPNDKSIHELFEQQAELSGNRIAVVVPAAGRNIYITYKELNEKADNLAWALKAKSCGSGSIISIIVHPSIDTIVGIMAVLKTGSCYLPIDATFPIERIKYMLEDSETRLLISQFQLLNKENFEVETLHIADLIAGIKPDDAVFAETRKIHGTVGLGNPIYLIYTSGTTGNPKGVLVKHENLINYVTWFSTTACLTKMDKSVLLSSFAFDLGYTSIYPTILNGGQLHLLAKEAYIFPPDLLAYISRHRITFLKMTPSLFSTIVLDSNFSQETCHNLRLIILGGEAINPIYIEIAYKKCENLVIMNHYGPTEATIGCIAQFIKRSDLENYKQKPTIGKPIFNTKVYILDKYANLLPLGVIGELCIGGGGLAIGYFKRKQLTIEKFVESVYDRYYRTGDLARWLWDGNIEFLGRIDHQVKIRGFRIELEEIANRLSTYPTVKEAVVLARQNGEDKYLCAYVVLNNNSESMSPVLISEIREFLTRNLPDYMIPSYFVSIDQIPLTPNGKIDRKSLPDPGKKSDKEYVAPRNILEEKLAGIWSEVLFGRNSSHTPVGIDDNFFQLGGHSLKAVIMLSQVRQELNFIVPLGEIFKTPTIRSVMEYIKNSHLNHLNHLNIQRDIDWNLVLIKHGLNENNNLFFVHDGSGEIEGYVEFCKHLTNNFNCWGIRADRLENLAPCHVTIQELAESYVKSIRKIQLNGPYYICGWSLGGTIAVEMASQLIQMNQTINFLALIDSSAPKKAIAKKTMKFTKQSESEWIQHFLGNSDEIKRLLEKTADIEELWSAIANYIVTPPGDFNLEIIKKLIPQGMAQIIPNFQHLSITELIYHLNRIRTLDNARNKYIPSSKINEVVHFFAAERSPVLAGSSWTNYFKQPLKIYKIKGDHFSIMQMPEVIKFACIFDQVLQEIKTHSGG